MYKYKFFYEKTQALKRETPRWSVFTKLKAIQIAGLDLSFTWV